MSIVQGLDWAVSLVPKLFAAMNSWMITDGLSVMAFSVGMILILIVVGAFTMRV